MVVRTRRALRDKTPAQNEVPEAGPSTSYTVKRNKTTPPPIQELELSEGNLFDEAQTISPNPGISNTLSAVQSTPIPNKKRKKQHHRVPFPTRPSSSLPPSSPLATSPTNNHNPDGDDDDDPFGFLVVEKKLRAQRAEMKIGECSKRQRVYDDNGIEDMYATDEEYITGDFVTPATTGEQQALDTPDAYPPRTPSKRNNKRKLVDSPALTSGSSTPRIPTSPSPVKVPETARIDARAAVKDKGGSSRPKKKVHAKVQEDEGDEEMDPSMIAEHLEGLLPKKTAKRPMRKVTRRVLKRGKVVEGSGSDPEEITRKRGKKASTRLGKKPTVSKGKMTKKPVVLELDEEQEKARRERIEYFKRLDDYELAKENVYVV